MYRIKDLLSTFGSLQLRKFSTLLVEQYQTDLLNKNLKPASVNKNISLLKAMIKKAVDWEMVEESMLKKVRAVKLFPENNRRLRFLSKTECQELIISCDTHLRPIVITAINTGMRRGEILNLTWEQVDMKHGFILLDITKNGERREIPINSTLRSTLQGITRRLDVPFVFFDTKTGKAYQEVKKSFKTALRRAKIQDFKFHDLRHTFASHLVMAGVDITTVKELLGHKDIKMTLRYAHLAPFHKVKAVDLLDSKINGEEVSTIQKLYNQPKTEVSKQCLTAVTH
jgi:integrase